MNAHRDFEDRPSSVGGRQNTIDSRMLPISILDLHNRTAAVWPRAAVLVCISLAVYVTVRLAAIAGSLGGVYAQSIGLQVARNLVRVFLGSPHGRYDGFAR